MATGALKTVTDRSGNRFEYTDDAMGRLRFLRTYTPGNVNGVTQEWTYDPDSRVVTRTFSSASGVSSADGTRRYDARGKLLAAQASGPGYGATTSLAMSYDGLGGLLLSTVNYVSLAKQEEYRRDAFGNTLFEGTLGETNRPTPLTYQYGVNGRLQRREANLPTGTPVCGYTYPDTLVQHYDVFGNLSRRTRATYLDGAPGTCTQTGTGLDYEFHWYGADNKLMVLQRDAGSPDRTTRTGTWEEYWYDALGRRILIRERREDLANGSNMESALTQVLWDGDRLLFELRSQPPNGQGGGPGSRYGTLGYIHGRELDAPLALTDGRILIPDWRGAYQGSVFASGAPADCATGQANPCTAIEFPAGNIAATFRQFVVSPSGVTYTWRGSLIGAGRDGSGLMYRRNRYYDPLTGRFTQVDPMGLAGGLNLYGYASGDPVNFGDPFGLMSDGDSAKGAQGTRPGGVLSIGLTGVSALGLFGLNAEAGVAINVQTGDYLYFFRFGRSVGLGMSGGLEIAGQKGSLSDFLGTRNEDLNPVEAEFGVGTVGGNVLMEGGPQRSMTPIGGGISVGGGASGTANMTFFTASTPVKNLRDILSSIGRAFSQARFSTPGY